MYAAAISRLEGSTADGIHLVWSGPDRWIYSPRGYTILRRRAQRVAPQLCDVLDGARLETLHREHVMPFAFGAARFRRGDCPGGLAPLRRDDRTGPGRAREPRVMARAASPTCSRYRFDLADTQRVVAVRLATSAMLAIALRGDQVLQARQVSSPEGQCAAVFTAAAIDRVIVYCPRSSGVQICIVSAEDWSHLDRSWSERDVLVRLLQLPVREINPQATTPAEELAMAHSRMLDPAAIGPAEMERIADHIRPLVRFEPGPPALVAGAERETLDEQFLEHDPLTTAMLPGIEADGRRLLGLAHRDASALVPGETYDYRIIGWFPEIDLRDRLLTFARVPTGSAVPDRVLLGDVLVRLPAPGVVALWPPPPDDSLRQLGRRGLRLTPEQDPGVTLELAAPVTELTLELGAVWAGSLRYRASASPYLGFPSASFVGTVPNRAQATLEFAAPIDRLELGGDGFFHGLRLHGVTGADRRRERAMEVDVLGVTYEASPPPAPPTELAVDNLQEAPAPPEADGTFAPAHGMGFRVRWRPALAGGVTAWPQELGAPPPLEAGAFRLERRRVDEPGAPWMEAGGRGLFGSRYRAPELEAITPGTDLVALHAESGLTEGADDVFTHDDPLWPPGAIKGPPPGSTWQYRIASVDVSGRPSAWLTSTVVRLEKRVPPPPPAPPPLELPPGRAQPQGVRALVVQRGDPDLPAADQALLAPGHDNVVVLEWGWTDKERESDPLAVHFRVYFQPDPLDVVDGELSGPIVAEGTRWRCRFDLLRPVEANALAGLRVASGEYGFRIHEHGSGSTPTAWLRRLEVSPSVSPVEGPLHLRRDLRGGAQRPAAFAERTAVVDIAPGQELYRFFIYDRLHPSAERPRHVAWVGVSSADDQAYVPDVLPAAVPNGGRPGNESQVMTQVVMARHLGRPVLAVPPPLAEVPERATDEPVASELVRAELLLEELLRPPPPPAAPLGAGDRVVLERLAASEITSRLRRNGPQAFAVRGPDGSEVPYAPANPSDRAALEAQVRSGQPEQVEGRFVRDVLIRVPALAGLFRAIGPPVSFGRTEDLLPPAPDRWLYRLRRADAAGRLSPQAALLDEIIRVPSLRKPGRPELTLAPSEDDRVRGEVRLRPAFDLRWALVFTDARPLAEAPATVVEPLPDLVRLPNRRDLYPGDGIRLRTAGGRLLSPLVIPIAGMPDAQGLVALAFDQAVGRGRRVKLWAVALSRDGIPSAPAGPREVVTAREPLQAPAVVVERAGSKAVVHWSGVGTPSLELRVERRTNAAWRPVSAWVREELETAEIFLGSGPAEIRMAVRSADGRSAVGPTVAVAES